MLKTGEFNNELAGHTNTYNKSNIIKYLTSSDLSYILVNVSQPANELASSSRSSMKGVGRIVGRIGY